MSQIEVSGPVA